MTNLTDDIRAFEAHHAELEKEHFGKWIVFYDAEFIGAFDTLDSAASVAVRRFGKGPYLIRQVGASPITLSAAVAYHPLDARA